MVFPEHGLSEGKFVENQRSDWHESHQRKLKIEQLETELEKLKQHEKELEDALEQAKDGREESVNDCRYSKINWRICLLKDERTDLLKELAKEEELCEKYKTELQNFRDCDPAIMEAKSSVTDFFFLKRWILFC